MLPVACGNGRVTKGRITSSLLFQSSQPAKGDSHVGHYGKIKVMIKEWSDWKEEFTDVQSKGSFLGKDIFDRE